VGGRNQSRRVGASSVSARLLYAGTAAAAAARAAPPGPVAPAVRLPRLPHSFPPRVQEVGQGQQAQRVAGGSRVEYDAGEASVLGILRGQQEQAAPCQATSTPHQTKQEGGVENERGH
jgi:hypothetical protein